ncbi:hypothetical protein niasHT_016016 [Heterodera trifolii]|uniref:Uncharacterized protein n=1 Tax=Heterodera trifolii TaxID=157864 RepID=A0ABD2LFQ7_9BILA
MVPTTQKRNGKLPRQFVKQQSFPSVHQFASDNLSLKDRFFMKLAYSAQQSPVNDSKQCNNSFLHCRNAAQSTQFSLEGELIQRKKTTVHNQHMNSLMFPLSERKAKSLCGIQSTTNIRKALKHHILEENGRKNSLNLITQKAKSMHRKISEFTFANNEPLIAAGKAIGLVHLVISTSSVSFEQTVTSTKKGLVVVVFVNCVCI